MHEVHGRVRVAFIRAILEELSHIRLLLSMLLVYDGDASHFDIIHRCCAAGKG